MEDIKNKKIINFSYGTINVNIINKSSSFYVLQFTINLNMTKDTHTHTTINTNISQFNFIYK